MGLKRTLEADAQLAEASKPGICALDRPPMHAQAVVLPDASTSPSRNDAPLVQVLLATRNVVALVCVQFVRAAGTVRNFVCEATIMEMEPPCHANQYTITRTAANS